MYSRTFRPAPASDAGAAAAAAGTTSSGASRGAAAAADDDEAAAAGGWRFLLGTQPPPLPISGGRAGQPAPALSASPSIQSNPTHAPAPPRPPPHAGNLRKEPAIQRRLRGNRGSEGGIPGSPDGLSAIRNSRNAISGTAEEARGFDLGIRRGKWWGGVRRGRGVEMPAQGGRQRAGGNGFV